MSEPVLTMGVFRLLAASKKHHSGTYEAHCGTYCIVNPEEKRVSKEEFEAKHSSLEKKAGPKVR